VEKNLLVTIHLPRSEEENSVAKSAMRISTEIEEQPRLLEFALCVVHLPQKKNIEHAGRVLSARIPPDLGESSAAWWIKTSGLWWR
jgi:hypothetical protein